MATGGYKCVKFSWQGGRTDSAVDRVKFVLNGVCDAIIGANVGWQLDTLTPTSSDFLEMPTSNASSPNLLKVLKLEYNSHTYRFGVGLVYKHTATLKPQDIVATQSSSGSTCEQTGDFGGGPYFGMVKDGNFISDATYNYVWDGNGDFLRWTPFVMSYQSSQHTFVEDNTGTTTYSYYFVLKNAQIAIFERSSVWSANSRLKGMILGEIFKETGHLSDTHTMGSCSLSVTGTDDGETVFQTGSGYFINSTTGYNLITSPGTGIMQYSQIISYSGNVFYGLYGTRGNYSYFTGIGLDTTIANSVVSSVITSPGGRWTPVYMYINAADHDTYGVVPGDGFKGYIDTDLLRGVNPNYSYGQQLQGGDFVYLGGGFAIGWDADNEILLF